VTGSEITTPVSFVATPSSLVSNNVKPVFVDIDENTLSIYVSKIKYAIEEDTSAIVPVHVFGNCCEVEKIDMLSKKHNLKVIY
ncbi:DegT/DnrJ/EryC1/StrS family aminotransferase, partial [Francisella tularensis subsp. holarctica]|uniref:DegT/DnrJ/EryC1/StrS family aminotransferase n=1 Tax=Francisella tularensis TaxID=263 RepID=UPI002381CB48